MTLLLLLIYLFSCGMSSPLRIALIGKRVSARKSVRSVPWKKSVQRVNRVLVSKVRCYNNKITSTTSDLSTGMVRICCCLL